MFLFYLQPLSLSWFWNPWKRWSQNWRVSMSMNWALCNSTDSEGQGSLAGCSLWGCKESDTTEWTIAQKGILAMCPEQIRGTANPNLNVTSESQVHCVTYWGESAHVNTLCSWSELRNGLQWPSSCHEEVKPCWNLPLPGLSQPAHGGRVGEVRIFPQVSGRGSARHLRWERRASERACVLHHTQLGSPVHIFSSKPSQSVRSGLPCVAESAQWEDEMNPGKLHCLRKLGWPGPRVRNPGPGGLSSFGPLSSALTNFMENQLRINRVSVLLITDVLMPSQTAWS